MGTAKAIAITTRPGVTTQLCFESDGILGELHATLGTQVHPLNFTAFYGAVSSSPTDPADPSLLLYDDSKIKSTLGPHALAVLRAEPVRAALGDAIRARQNTYFSKFANSAGIMAKLNDLYSSNVVGSKPGHIAGLRSLADDQKNQLMNAYINDGRFGVIRNTNSELLSTTDSSVTSSSITFGNANTSGESSQQGVYPIGEYDETIFQTGPSLVGLHAEDAEVSFQDTMDAQTTFSSDSTGGEATSSAFEHQMVVNVDYGYRIPFIENQAQHARAQISLIDEQFAQFMFEQNLPYLNEIFDNELRTIDSSVYRMQLAYAGTFLLSPVGGVVTGVYRQPGDAVRAGEPVLRVENNDTVLLQASLVYRGLITTASTVTVETALFDAGGAPVALSGSPVSVRGGDDDEHWNVVVQCDNVGAGSQILPIDYTFDRDDTQVSIA